MKLSVREASTEDLGWILDQLKSFSDFFGSKMPLYSDEFATDGVLAMMEKHVFLVAVKEDDTPVGLIAGFLAPHPFNPGIILLTEAFWWVEEQYRGSRAGLMLLNAFTEIGKDRADWIIFTLEEKSPVNPACLTKRGFRPIEHNFMMEVS